VQHTYKTEGTLGFWRGETSLIPAIADSARADVFGGLGVTAPLASITLVRTVSFSIYQKAKYTYSAWFERATGSAPLVIVNTPGSLPTFSTVTCFGAAGATAGGIITIIACRPCRTLLHISIRLTGRDTTGPFELTKLSAQISVLMAKTNAASVDDPIRRSYQQLGTFKTAKNIVKHRGVMGLYSGFHLHLCE
jgi:solute carrier family 25 carnitine/acylcarnitine transporter 20/29